MRKIVCIMLGVAFILGLGVAQAGPEEDRQAFVNYFTKRFPDTPLDDFVNGIYSIDKASREQWEEIEEFPPYELAIDEGQTLFETPFANGKNIC